jgi:ClpP class serine protease
LTPEQRKLFQDDVDESHAWFISDVLKVRTYADPADMQGQCWTGKKAAEKNLINGIVDSIDALYMAIDPTEYAAHEKTEPHKFPMIAGYAQAADVSPEQGDDEDGVAPISDDKKKKKKKKKKPDGTDSDEDEDEDKTEIPDDGCPPIDTDCKPKA